MTFETVCPSVCPPQRCCIMLPHSKRRAPATCKALDRSSNLGNRKSEFGRHVAVSWQVAVDFEPNADFNQYRCRPGHGVLPLDLRKIHRAVVQTISPTSNSEISDRKKRFRNDARSIKRRLDYRRVTNLLHSDVGFSAPARFPAPTLGPLRGRQLGQRQ